MAAKHIIIPDDEDEEWVSEEMPDLYHKVEPLDYDITFPNFSIPMPKSLPFEAGDYEFTIKSCSIIFSIRKVKLVKEEESKAIKKPEKKEGK